jgi:serine/threonine-protein kinase
LTRHAPVGESCTARHGEDDQGLSSAGKAGEDLVGTVLQDSYRVTRLIGRGGMGTVYQGTQLRLSKRVAIKVLARELSSNQEALARFRREAEVTSQLGHPHIVQVNDFGTTPSGEPYLVMEFLEGEDLDQRLRRARRLPLAITANVIKQIASALSSTHARGIVHRDLKPANVFLMEIEGESDFVKIVDFGISKVRAASLRLTSASAVMGTPNYMSPEQAAGQVEEVDHRTDQWSLACIAYEMLSGRGPFLGDTIHSLLFQVVHQDPPRLGSLVAGLPPEVETVVARAMAKAKADRFPTISAFSRAFVAAAAAAATATAGPVSASVAIAPTEASVPPARVEAQRPAAAPVARAAGADEPPIPQPTTLSQTASELVTPLSRLRAGLRSRWVLVAGAAAAIAVAGAVIYSRQPRSARVDAAVNPASTAGDLPAAGARAPIVSPIAAPASPPAATTEAPAAPPPPAPAPPPPATAPQPATAPPNGGGKPKRSKTRPAPAAAPAAKAPTTAPTTKTPPPRPAGPRGSIIEEL